MSVILKACVICGNSLGERQSKTCGVECRKIRHIHTDKMYRKSMQWSRIVSSNFEGDGGKKFKMRQVREISCNCHYGSHKKCKGRNCRCECHGKIQSCDECKFTTNKINGIYTHKKMMHIKKHRGRMND